MEGEPLDPPPNALDMLGPDTFDWSEFDSPDEKQLTEIKGEIEFLRETAGAFIADYKTWTFDNITQQLDELIQKVKTYEKKYGDIKYRGYIATKILPTVALFLCEQTQTRLPASCQLLPDQSDTFIFQFAKLLDPDRYYDAFVNIINYSDLLHWQSEQKWSRTLDTNMANWLKTNAAHALSQLSQIEVPDDETEQQCEFRIKNLVHLTRIARGQFPFGHNTEFETQWELWNVDFLLDPTGDIRQEKLVSGNTYNYLMRTANDRMALIQDAREQPRPDMTQRQADEEERAFQHLKHIVDTGELPYGYRPVDLAVQEPVVETMKMDEDAGEF